MNYWVYENWIHDFAKIHKESCGSCNYGAGLFGGGRRRSGQWHGPFSSKEETVRVAKATHRTSFTNCGSCRGAS